METIAAAISQTYGDEPGRAEILIAATAAAAMRRRETGTP
jgi:hypothetical protein